MDAFLKKVDQVAVVDTSKLNMFLLKEKALEFTKILSENPNFTQGKICKMLGTSDSTMRRIRNDLGMPSPFRHAVKIKSKKKGKEKEKESGLGPTKSLNSDKFNSDKFNSDKFNSDEGKSFYCTECSKVFKSSKSSQNHVCKNLTSKNLRESNTECTRPASKKDVLASGNIYSIFNKNLTSRDLRESNKGTGTRSVTKNAQEEESEGHSEGYSEGDEELDKVLNRG